MMRLKWKLSLFLFCCCLIAFVSGGYAAVLVESTFDADDDGWRVGEFLLSTGSTTTPTYLASGGNPGGYIQTGDNYGWNAYLAPAKFLGDQSAAFDGNLTFDQRVLSSDGIAYYTVVLEGNSLQIGYSAGLPGTSWTNFSIPLNGAGWFKNLNTVPGYGGVPITPAELLGVLTNLTALRLEADWQVGNDRVDLDNVRLLSSAPVPPSILFVATGLLSLALGVRRKKKLIN